ncbi:MULTISPECIES: hypothetical protein [Streptomyces]|uniref:hypothetical protein n=1 Tax=Streptomyces TaxID=1883 RepID=UPI001C8EA02B|nr:MULTISPECIES: hypothetical protein [Streptomyces]UBI40770.1 hypothetical protein K7I03_32760 [Streptomyces mobaraensis]UKW33350.1 hypothetical protein MCU78_32685 [Streptomyces sp. TYQ1024]
MSGELAAVEELLTGARTRRQVARAYRRIRAGDGPGRDGPYARGAAAGYRWALGAPGGAPVTGATPHGGVGMETLMAEVDAAVVQLDDPAQPPAAALYTQGAHDALAWICGLSDDHP